MTSTKFWTGCWMMELEAAAMSSCEEAEGEACREGSGGGWAAGEFWEGCWRVIDGGRRGERGGVIGPPGCGCRFGTGGGTLGWDVDSSTLDE